MSRSRLRTLIPLGLPVLLSGCLAVAAAGTGSSIGYVATEDRSLQQNADDIVTCTQAIQLWAQFNTQLNDDLNCHTYNGRMLVTGNVPTEAWRDEAIKRAWQAKNVKEVYDEITVSQGQGFMSDAHDAVTTQKLKAELLTDPDVRSNNYIVTTENRVVYIIGSAHSEAEKQRVIDRARDMSGVRRVITYIRIDSNAPGAAESTSPGAAGSPAGSTESAPPPSPPTPVTTSPVAPPPTPAPTPAPAAAAPAPATPPPGPNDTPANAATPRGDIAVTPLH
ncbi:MAG TPA: BON domain-containing protein [Stellaceae bacterium]|nr:BON domain-containing protein [Stellaceae bacterium]